MTTEKADFDLIHALLDELLKSKPLLGKTGILAPFLRQLTGAALEAAPAPHLGQEIKSNRKSEQQKDHRIGNWQL